MEKKVFKWNKRGGFSKISLMCPIDGCPYLSQPVLKDNVEDLKEGLMRLFGHIMQYHRKNEIINKLLENRIKIIEQGGET